MKKQGLLLILLTIIALNSFSQVRRTAVKPQVDSAASQSKASTPKNSRKEMMEELNLSIEQKQKMKEINQAGKATREAIEADSTISDADKKTKLRTFRREQYQKIKAILTEEQKLKFEAWRAKNGLAG